MVPENREKQLELFQGASPAVRRPAREAWGPVWLPLRYDQVVLIGIGGLLGLTVVFAVGVERGKELVRGEHAMLARQQTTPPAVLTTAKPPATTVAAKPETRTASTKVETKATPPPATPVMAPKPKTRTKLASGSSRYAVQVVTYSQLRLAKQEMDRLRARGEQAFLVMRDGRTIVYVGPFPSRNHASEKVITLKPRYGDCFVRTL